MFWKVVDVQSSKQVNIFAEAVRKKLGRCDFLVNNAGIAYDKPLLETTEKEWDQTIDTNLKGVFLCCKAFLPLQPKVIVNISSGAGKNGFAGLSAYCASKFGVLGLTESLAQETDAKVYAVCPGPVDTKMYWNLWKEHPLRKPKEVTRVVLDLCFNPDKPSGASVDVF